MPSLDGLPDRHVVIDRREGQYLSFPDVRLTKTGRLVCVYREADKHVAARSRLLAKTSSDLGRTWSDPVVVRAGSGHCPRLTVFEDGRLVVVDDMTQSLYVSRDDGESFSPQPYQGMVTTLTDRILELTPGKWLTTGHTHRGAIAQPAIRQAPSEQMAYRSEDDGRTWTAWSVIAFDRNLVLCEGSITRLVDGRLLCLMRENSFVYEPMYFSLSDDEARTWSLPRPTPLIGHRPCVDTLEDGRLLVTYRNVAPEGGTAAWLGALEELDRDFAVHAWRPDPANPIITPRGLLIENASGHESAVRYALRPMTDATRARARLDVEVLVEQAEENACALHFGQWWRLTPGRLHPEHGPSIALPIGAFASLSFRYEPGLVRAFVDGKPVAAVRVDPRQADTRAILAGCSALKKDNGGRHFWRRMELAISEPAYDREYLWRWDHTQGHPDAWARAHVLELENDRLATSGDFGYSGWTRLPDGGMFCAYHHAGGDDPEYRSGFCSHVRGVKFYESDFTSTGENP